MKNINRIIGKLNVATLALIVAIYITALILILIAVNPKHNYVVEPDYDHVTDYDELSNRFQVIFRRTSSSGKINETYSIRSSIVSRTTVDDNTDVAYVISKYQMEAMEESNKEYYFSEQTNHQTPWSYNTSLGSEHTPVAMYSSLKYIDNEGNAKYKNYKEEFLEAPNKLKNYTDGNKINFGDDSFTYQIIGTKDENNDYLISMRLRRTMMTYFHIDLQTWLVDDDGNLLPFIGVYNHTKEEWSVSSERVIKELKAKAIVCRLICYYQGQTFELNYKVELENIKSSYNQFEDIDAINAINKENSSLNKVIAIICVSCAFVVIITTTTIAFIRVKKGKKSASLEQETKKDIDTEAKN